MWKKIFGRGEEDGDGTKGSLPTPETSVTNKKKPEKPKPAAKGEPMSDNMITAENLSVEMLKEIFEAAFMDATIDEDGDLLVKEACKVFVRPDLERKNSIRFFTLFGFNDSASKMDRFECANKINNEYLMVTACATDNCGLIFRYDLAIEGGIPKKGLVLAFKRFASIPHAAAADHGQGLLD